jgi:hypothetical protein
MGGSKGTNVCKIGEKAIKKAEFCRLNRQKLIGDMERVNLEPKQYKIMYFINTQFLMSNK